MKMSIVKWKASCITFTGLLMVSMSGCTTSEVYDAAETVVAGTVLVTLGGLAVAGGADPDDIAKDITNIISGSSSSSTAENSNATSYSSPTNSPLSLTTPISRASSESTTSTVKSSSPTETQAERLKRRTREMELARIQKKSAQTRFSETDSCIILNENTGAFYNSCQYDAIVKFRTIGGGCYRDRTGKGTGAGVTTVDRSESSYTGLDQDCGSSDWKNEWVWCDYEEWVSGDCKLNFKFRI